MPRGTPKAPEPKRPRPQGSGSIFYNAQKGRYQATIDLGRNAEGHRDRRSYFARIRGEVTEAEQECKGWLALTVADAIRGTLPVRPSRETVKGFLTGWWEDTAQVTTANRTWREYGRKLELYVYPVIGHLQLDRLDVRDIQAVYATMHRTVSERTERHLSNNTILTVHRVLHMALGDRIVWKGVKPPALEEYVATVLQPEEFVTLMEAARGTRYELIWHLMVMALRPEEVLGLRRQDIDWSAGRIRIEETIPTVGPREPGKPKSKRSRRAVLLPQLILDGLRAYCETRAEYQLKAGGRVFCTDTGETLKWEHVYRDGWQALYRACPEVTYVRPYDLRHLAASYWLDQGVPLTTVSETLGHSSTTITTDVYAHKLRRSDSLPAEATGRLLGMRRKAKEELG